MGLSVLWQRRAEGTNDLVAYVTTGDRTYIILNTPKGSMDIDLKRQRIQTDLPLEIEPYVPKEKGEKRKIKTEKRDYYHYKGRDCGQGYENQQCVDCIHVIGLQLGLIACGKGLIGSKSRLLLLGPK